MNAVLQACSAFRDTLSDADLAMVEEVLELFKTEEVCNGESCSSAVEVRANSPVVYLQAAAFAKPHYSEACCMRAFQVH